MHWPRFLDHPVYANLFVGVRKDSDGSCSHLVHDLCNTDHLALVVEYWHTEYTGSVIASLLVDDLIEAWILQTSTLPPVM